MSIDLNSLPGLLDLENCQTYRAFIYPNSFPRGGDLENDNSSSIWSRGYSKDFIYEDSNGLVPNQVNLSQIISFELICAIPKNFLQENVPLRHVPFIS